MDERAKTVCGYQSSATTLSTMSCEGTGHTASACRLPHLPIPLRPPFWVIAVQILPLYRTIVKRVVFIAVLTRSALNTFFFLFFGIAPMENSGCIPRGKLAATKSCHSTYGACCVFTFFHNPPNSNMDFKIFSVRIDVNA